MKKGKKHAAKESKTTPIDVIIPCRNETLIGKTVENLRASATGPLNIVVVFDHEQPFECGADVIIETPDDHCGTGFTRHHGIMSSDNPIIFTCDGHMNFSRGWDEVIRKELAEFPKAVICGTMYGAHESIDPEKNHKYGYTGCRFRELSEEPNNHHFIMCAKWAVQKTGEIGSVMGACYAFKRDHYHRIGRPWGCSIGWGCDEEFISAGSWLMGGSVRLADFSAGHYVREHAPWPDHSDGVYTLVNRARYHRALPIPEFDRMTYDAWLEACPLSMHEGYITAAAGDARREEVKDLCKLWSKGDWTRMLPWIDRGLEPLVVSDAAKAERMKKWTMPPIITPPTELQYPLVPVAPIPIVPNVVVRDRIRCPNCFSYDSLKVRETRTIDAGTLRRLYCSNPGCPKKAHSITNGNSVTLVWHDYTEK
jgi:hypothetical protein